MATRAVTDEQLQSIADAIKLKSGDDTPMSVEDMALRIGLIEGGSTSGVLELLWSADLADIKSNEGSGNVSGTLGTFDTGVFVSANPLMLLHFKCIASDDAVNTIDECLLLGVSQTSTISFSTAHYKKLTSGEFLNDTYTIGYNSTLNKGNGTITLNYRISNTGGRYNFRAGDWRVELYRLDSIFFAD